MMCREKVIEEMKQRVYEANIRLVDEGLIKLTWGNVSEINRELGIIVIKPSGVPYSTMNVEDMVVTDLSGNPIETGLKPSSDMATHAYLYDQFKTIGAVVHTHSENAVMWAQTGRDVPAYGTTHADHFYGNVPCARELTVDEIQLDYELNTGKVIVEKFKTEELDPEAVPGVLVKSHGPFCWGETPTKAVDNAIVLEVISKMAKETEILKSLEKIQEIPNYLLDKHYFRKHGKEAYYGQ